MARGLFASKCGHLAYCRHRNKSLLWCMEHCIATGDHRRRDIGSRDSRKHQEKKLKDKEN